MVIRLSLLNLLLWISNLFGIWYLVVEIFQLKRRDEILNTLGFAKVLANMGAGLKTTVTEPGSANA